MAWRENAFINKLKFGSLWQKISDVWTQLTANILELNLLDGAWASITTSTTPATGSCAVQFVFKDANGVTMAAPVTGRFYLSEVATGLTQDPANTSIAVLTNGAVTELDAAHKAWQFTTTAAGLLGITITALADSYWVVFEGPGGLLIISDECVVN